MMVLLKIKSNRDHNRILRNQSKVTLDTVEAEAEVEAEEEAEEVTRPEMARI